MDEKCSAGLACVWAARFGGEARVWTRNLEGEALAVQHLTLANAMAAFFFRYEGEYRNVEPALWAE